MAPLADTGFLLAVLANDDPRHEVCVETLRREPQILVCDVVLPELAYLVLRDLNHRMLATFLRSVGVGRVTYLSTTRAELVRAADLIEQYADARIDFVDCVIVAMAERLNITRILSVDRRHLTMIRPKHCAYFEILP